MRNTGLARHRPYQPKMANAVEPDFNEAPVGVPPNSLEERPCCVETCDVLWWHGNGTCYSRNLLGRLMQGVNVAMLSGSGTSST